VLRTVVGYCGGAEASPTYHDLGDHTECIRIEFDPKRISYEKLLDIFWSNHSASSWSRQYRSVVLYHDDMQRTLAETAAAARGGSAAGTAIEPCGVWTAAEHYHQHYYLQNDKLMPAFESLTPTEFADSFTAMRLNAIVSHRGVPSLYERELDAYQLPSPQSRARVRELAQRCTPGRRGCS